jgi:FkbM family methyltransferase
MLLKVEAKTVAATVVGYLLGSILMKTTSETHADDLNASIIASHDDRHVTNFPIDTLFKPEILEGQYSNLVNDGNFMNSISSECQDWIKNWKHRDTFVSQVSQDWWLFANAFRKRNGFFIDLGAHEPRKWSNTYFFEQCLGWQGICVEANPYLAKGFKGTRNCIMEQTCISDTATQMWFKPDGPVGEVLSYIPTRSEITSQRLIKVPCTTLDKLFEKHKVKHVDFISIDVEGLELSILKSFQSWEKVDWIVAETMWATMHLNWVIADKGFWRISDIGGADDVYVRAPVPKQPSSSTSNRDVVYNLVKAQQQLNKKCVNGAPE